MPDDTINARPEDVRKLALALDRYRANVKNASKDVRKALDAAYWHDSRKDQFEARYRDLQKHVDGFLGTEVDQMVKQLNAYARRLEELRSMKM